jgi:hypothetical protein
VDEGAADATVAVGEGVDGLELRVGDGGVDHGGEVRSVHERDQVAHEVLHPLGRGRDEVGAAGVERVAADPVLAVAEFAGDLGRGRREHQAAVDVEDVLQPEWLRRGAEGDRVLHRGDVAEDGPGGLVPGSGSSASARARRRWERTRPSIREDAIDSARSSRRARTSRLATRGGSRFRASTARSAVETAAATLDGSASSICAIGSGTKAR